MPGGSANSKGSLSEAAGRSRITPSVIVALRARREITSFWHYCCAMADLADTLARRYAVMRPFLSEFQRRLWLGAEAAELGPGGVAVVAGATGVAVAVAVDVEVDPGPDPDVAGARPPGHRHGDASIAA